MNTLSDRPTVRPSDRTAADLAIDLQHATDAVLAALEAGESAHALVKLAAVEEFARRTAAAIQVEARAHLEAEAIAAARESAGRCTHADVAAYARKLQGACNGSTCASAHAAPADAAEVADAEAELIGAFAGIERPELSPVQLAALQAPINPRVGRRWIWSHERRALVRVE